MPRKVCPRPVGESLAGELRRTESPQLISLIWVRRLPLLSCQDGHDSRKARQALGQSSIHVGTLGYIAITNAVAGADAPGRGAGDVDGGGHCVVNARGGELSLRTRGRGRSHGDRLERMIGAAAGQEDN